MAVCPVASTSGVTAANPLPDVLSIWIPSLCITLPPFLPVVNTYFDNLTFSLDSLYSLLMSLPGPAARAARDPSRIRADARIGLLQALPQRSKAAKAAGPFSDLTWHQQRAAEQWLHKFCARWGSDLPPWRRAILTGVARRLAKNPPAEGFGLSLLRVRSGHGLARKCRATGMPHTIQIARRARRQGNRSRVPLPSCQLAV